MRKRHFRGFLKILRRPTRWPSGLSCVHHVHVSVWYLDAMLEAVPSGFDSRSGPTSFVMVSVRVSVRVSSRKPHAAKTHVEEAYKGCTA